MSGFDADAVGPQLLRHDLERYLVLSIAEPAGGGTLRLHIPQRDRLTLEEGGNITLATLRKILTHLPNLETFTFDAVTATVRRQVSHEEKRKAVDRAVELLATALYNMFSRDDHGAMIQDEDLRALKNASAAWNRALDIADQPGPPLLVEEPQPAAERGDAASAFASTLALARRRRNRARAAKGAAETE